LTSMKHGRMIVDIESMEQARRVEETVKSGYSEVIIEALVQWVAVEEDLVSSYDRLAKSLPESAQRKLAENLLKESRKNITVLSELVSKFEAMDKGRQRRIEAVAKQGG
jgi:hypothetical protein